MERDGDGWWGLGFARVAQLAERLFRKQEVPGSTPGLGFFVMGAHAWLGEFFSWRGRRVAAALRAGRMCL